MHAKSSPETYAYRLNPFSPLAMCWHLWPDRSSRPETNYIALCRNGANFPDRNGSGVLPLRPTPLDVMFGRAVRAAGTVDVLKFVWPAGSASCAERRYSEV